MRSNICKVYCLSDLDINGIHERTSKLSSVGSLTRGWMIVTVSWRNLAFTPRNGRWCGKCNDRHRKHALRQPQNCADEGALVVRRNFSNTR